LHLNSEKKKKKIDNESNLSPSSRSFPNKRPLYLSSFLNSADQKKSLASKGGSKSQSPALREFRRLD